MYSLSLFSRLAKKWQDLPLNHKGLLLNALPLLVLFASLTSLYISEQQAAKLESKLITTLNTQRDIQAVHTQLVEASTAVRDYLLTGNPSFLGTHQQAEQQLPTMLANLNLQFEDAAQQQRIKKIVPLVGANLAALRLLADHKQRMNANDVVEAFSLQADKLDTLSAEIKALSARESVLVKLEQAELNLERQRNFNLTMLAALAGIIGSLVGAWIFSDTIVRRVRLIRDSAAHLAKGEPLALPSISRDELGQLTEELAHASQLLSSSAQEAHLARIEAEDASAAKSTFLSRTSHELRTPLNAILGFSQILAQDLPDGHQKDHARLISSAGLHLLKLINEVLDIAKIEHADMVVAFSEFNLAEMLDEAANYIQPLAKKRHMRLTTAYPAQILLLTNRQKLLQVVLNLLSNAFKYGPEHSTVFLRAHVTAHQIVIQIEDQGHGIAASHRARLFTPFDRLGAENTTTEGIGLGLALSKQMMDGLQGAMHVAHDKSLFCLEIPRLSHAESANNNAALSAEKSAMPIAPIAKFRILLLDDETNHRALIEAIIKRHEQFTLFAVTNIKAGLAQIQRLIPDFVLINCHLADNTCEDLVRLIKLEANYAEIKILVLSDDASLDTINRLKNVGVAEYFTKPLDVALFNAYLHHIEMIPDIEMTPINLND